MDQHAYEELIRQEKNHWWFFSRRAISYTLLRQTTLPPNPLILDVGCGSGGNLPMLASLGDVFALEMNDHVRAHAAKRNIGKVAFGHLPDNIPFPDITFDLVTMFDVLEHLEDDRASLQALSARMHKGAVLFLNVPAHPWLFSRQDREHHHHRRYSKRALRKLLHETGFHIQVINYWNCLLFPFAVIVRLLEKTKSQKSGTIGTNTPKPWLNNLLKKLVSAERHLIMHMPYPYGLSLIVIARKN